MKIKEIVSELNNFAPVQLQESYDNSGLNVGNLENEITGILLCIDVIPEVVEEAIRKNCNLIVSHHPLIRNEIKKLTGDNYVEKSIILAIQNDISIYCGHTNFDNHASGVSWKIAEKLNLKNIKILAPINNIVRKVSVFVPQNYAEKVRNTMFDAGAGKLGNYDCCSYNTDGYGSFKANENANPFVGESNKIHFEQEVKIEVIYPSYLENKIITAMLSAHPYEEVAYDVFTLNNKISFAGMGVYGEFEEDISELDFLKKLKTTFFVENIRHSKFLNKKIKKVAICGGSGSSLIDKVKQIGSDAFITGDVKYHDYFLAENRIFLTDIGHYESEQFTKEIFFDIINKKNVNFAVNFSEIKTNPINNY